MRFVTLMLAVLLMLAAVLGMTGCGRKAEDEGGTTTTTSATTTTTTATTTTMTTTTPTILPTTLLPDVNLTGTTAR